MPGRASRSASRAAAFAVAEATNVNATLTDELLELALGTLSLRSLRASALVPYYEHKGSDVFVGMAATYPYYEHKGYPMCVRSK